MVHRLEEGDAVSSPCVAMVVTDLDGTLMRTDRRVGSADLATLERLGAEGVLRVIATGRSLYSARLALAPDFPIDYLVFSSGAGVVQWSSQTLLRRTALAGPEVAAAVAAVESLELGFMLHAAIPENHHFVYRRVPRGAPVADFERRLERYRDFAREWRAGTAPPATASQLVAIADAARDDAYPSLASALPELRVIRATSPLDGRSRWLEVFPRGVGKASAAEWIARRHGVAHELTLSIGNDYNDEDLLDWAGRAFVVANAPVELRSRHPSVASNDDGGFSAAVRSWRGERRHFGS